MASCQYRRSSEKSLVKSGGACGLHPAASARQGCVTLVPAGILSRSLLGGWIRGGPEMRAFQARILVALMRADAAYQAASAQRGRVRRT